MNETGTWQQFIAEFIGTFFLVFFGCGSVILSELDPNFSSSLIPFVFGGTVTIMIYTLGHISGAHFNPAVSFAFFTLGKISIRKFLSFSCAQTLGALLASVFHLLIFGADHSFGMTTMNNLGAGTGMEFILSFLLMLVITSVATDSRAVGEIAGISIGLTVALCASIGGPLSGASMNPARSLAPAILSGELNQLYLYLIFPFLGTFLGSFIYRKIKCETDEDSEQGCC